MPKRVLIATQAFPPASGGSAVILYELLRHLPQEELIAVHGTNDTPRYTLPALGMEHDAVLLAHSRVWTLRCTRHCPQFYVPLIRRRILALARKHRVRRIYAHFPSAPFLIAAWQAAEELDLPLTVYFDILWEEAYLGGAPLARKYEQRILARADGRFAVTEFAAEYLQRKHGLPVQVLPHVIDLAGVAGGLEAVPEGQPPVIHFCGGIYPRMNQDAVARLASAARKAAVRPTLDLCAPDLPPGLRQQGLSCRYLGRDEVRAAQRHSTILYLPQAFESDHPLMIRNNFPTKAMEYLCSGRPILVHSPPDSYLTWLAKREGFALVVDRPDAGELAAAIDRLAGDRRLQEQLVLCALKFVRTRDARTWAARFWESLCRESGR